MAMVGLKLKLRIVPFVVAALTAVVMTATPAAAQVDPRNLGDGGVIRVPTNPASTGSWIQAVVEKYQLEKKYNVKIDYQMSSVTQLTANAIQTGAADLATFQFVQIALMRKAGAKIVAVAPFLAWGANQVIVPVDSTLKTVGDLRGKKLGIFNNIDIDWIVVQAIAKRDFKLDPKDIQTQVAGIGLLQALIQNGGLDATTVFNNLTPQLVSGGKVKVLVNIRDLIADLGLPEMPFLFQSVREEYAKEHPQNVRAYLAAFREAVAILAKDDEMHPIH